MNESPNILTVGDDDQSIYRFQGANLENMLHFSGKFPNTEIIVLSTNYRSGQEILDASSELISCNSTRLSSLLPSIEKPLISGLSHTSSVELVGYANPEAEKTDILHHIEEVARSGGDMTEVAILLRTNAQVAEWSEFLEQAGIPVQSKAIGNLFESEEFRLVSYILKAISDAKMDSFSLIELLRIGIFVEDRIGLYRLARNLENINFKTRPAMEFFEMLLSDSLLEASVGDALPTWIAARNTLLELRSIGQGDIVACIQKIDTTLGLRDFVQKKTGIAGLERLYRIFDFIAQGYATGKFKTLQSILAYWERMRQFNMVFK